MQFKDLKQNNTVFILNKQSVEVFNGKVTSNPTQPHYDSKFNNGSVQVVDVNVEFGGSTYQYVFQHDSEVGYDRNLILTTNRDIIIREIEMIKEAADKNIELMPKYQSDSAKCADILATFDPRIKEKQENDRRLTKLESSMESMGSDLRDFKKMFQKFMEEMGSNNNA